MSGVVQRLDGLVVDGAAGEEQCGGFGTVRLSCSCWVWSVGAGVDDLIVDVEVRLSLRFGIVVGCEGEVPDKLTEFQGQAKERRLLLRVELLLAQDAL